MKEEIKTATVTEVKPKPGNAIMSLNTPPSQSVPLESQIAVHKDIEKKERVEPNITPRVT
jgi:hypothetical protein